MTDQINEDIRRIFESPTASSLSSSHNSLTDHNNTEGFNERLNRDIRSVFETSISSKSISTSSSTTSGPFWTESAYIAALATTTDDDYYRPLYWPSPTTAAIQNMVTHNHKTAKIDLSLPPKRRRLSYHPSVRHESEIAPTTPPSLTHKTPSPWTPRWYEHEMSLRPSQTPWPPLVDSCGKSIPKYKPPKPDGVEKRRERVRKYERTHEGTNFLRRLFRDLDEACKNKTTAMEDEEVLELLRLATVWEIYHAAPARVRDVYHARLHGPLARVKESRRIGEVGDVLLPVVMRLDEEEYKIMGRRTYGFIKEHGLFTFVVCAHSYYFRRWITTGILDNDQQQQLDKHTRDVQDSGRGTDKPINALLKDNKASIEMFVRSRGFDWRRLAKRHKVFFRTFVDVISTVRLDEPEILEEKATGLWMTTRSKLQKKKKYLTDWEHPARPMDSPTLSFPRMNLDQHPHELVLSLDGKRVIRSQIEVPYSLTQTHVSEGGFRQRLATTTATEDPSRTSFVDVKMISSSFLAPDYVWPNSTRWPIPDPRYRSKITERCELCHKRPHRSTNYETCRCTLKDLQTELRRTTPGYSCNPLIELRQYPVKGTGVRTLQPLRKGDILAEYIGEIYLDIFYGTWPDINDNKPLFGKYYPGVATTYHMSCEIAKREFKKKTTKSTTINEAKKLPEDEYKMFVIDSAVYGNWTRYINHSCNAAATFQTLYLGNKMVTVVTMVKDLEFGEELTVDYGRLYWRGGRTCVCGESNCIGDGIEVQEGDEDEDKGEDEDEEEVEEEQEEEVLDPIVVDMTASHEKKRKRI